MVSVVNEAFGEAINDVVSALRDVCRSSILRKFSGKYKFDFIIA